MGTTKAQEYLQRGWNLLKRKHFEAAEDTLIAAFKAFPVGDRGKWTAAIGLGKVYRQTGRYADAIAALIKGLPYPAAFTELVSIYRFFAKAAKKDGDAVGSAGNYQKMFSLAKMNAVVSDVVREDPRQGWERAASWIDEVQKQCGTLYPYRFEGEEVAGGLLTAADYTAMRSFL